MKLDMLVMDLALILVASGIVTLIFKKLKQPVVLGYIVAGFLISPNFVYLPTIVEQGDIHVWANIGIIFLMFGLGLEFSFKKLATVGSSAFIIAATVMTSMILVGAGVGTLMGWGKMDCIFLGGMLSMSSTMIILKSYDEYNLTKEKFAQLVLGALVIEDIAGIFMLVVLSTISVGKNVSGIAMISQLGIMLLGLMIWVLLGIYIVPSLFRKIAGLLNNELILLLSVGFCLLMVVIANLMGFSSALGAFLAGSILAGTVQSERITALVKPVKDLFGAVFFVSVGMLIVPETLVEYIVPIILISLVVIFGQMIFSTAGIMFAGESMKTAIRGGFSMVQIGEFSFIIATLGMNLGVIGDYLYPIIVCVSVITAFTTPVFIKNGPRVYELINRKLPERVKIVIRRNTSENQTRNSMDPDWNQYMKRVVTRTAISFAILYLIYNAGVNYMLPFMRDAVGNATAASGISAAVMIICMLPFVNFMHGTNNALFVKLWVKHRSNHLPLVTMKAVRIFIAACFLSLVLRKCFSIPFVILVMISVIPIFFVVRSAWMNGVTIAMEKRFAANFSEKALERARRERQKNKSNRWLNESLHVIEFKITDPEFHKSIYDFTKRRSFVVTIIRIIRDNEFINMPSGDEIIQYGDVLQMLGTEDEVNACTMLLDRDRSIEYKETKDKILKDFIYGQRFEGMPEENELVCLPITLHADSRYIRHSIRNCNIRKDLEGSIIGIERGSLPMVSPSIDTVLRKDDIVWLMGGTRMVNKLIRKGYMDD